ncbi:MAG: hypothetical protein Q9186_004100 [Xanthomendoza sp. 1 TL-2023]
MASSSSSSPPPRKPLPQPVENTKRVQRRFAPEPVETTARSSRPPHKRDLQPADAATRPPHILPEPVESSARSSKQSSKHNDTASIAQASDFDPASGVKLPQPIESSQSSSKTRKFAPQLVETTSRQRKRGDTIPAVLDTDNTEHSPTEPIHLFRHLRASSRPAALPIPPANSPIVSTDQVPQLHESRFSYASLSRRTSLEQSDRRHSFRTPELPSIPSQTEEESEESDASSCLSQSTTSSAESEEVELRRNARTAQAGKTPGYLLSIAAQAAEKQLREQAMAAYPNEHSHEPVDHFAIDREDGGEEGTGLLSRSATYPPPASSESASVSRRESHAGWDAAYTRKHKDILERQRQDLKDRERSMAANSKHSVKEATSTKGRHHGHHQGHHHQHQHHEHHHNRQPAHHQNPAVQKNILGTLQKDDQMKPMQKAASPPMAGENLKFPRCKSPRQTRFDVSQHPGISIHFDHPKSRDHSGLWTPQDGASRQNSKSGLWMGVCALSAQKPAGPAMLQTGLITPAVEKDDPFTSSNAASTQQLPPSPPTSIGSSSKSCCLDEVLTREKVIKEEFHDGFVTQVYNYLSLGYPALARKYDEELSKITRIPVENLRQDDQQTNAKGYVGAPEGTGSDLRGVQEGQCQRWTALRLYVTEWAKQQPLMGVRDGAANEDWGARARKGSWAI